MAAATGSKKSRALPAAGLSAADVGRLRGALELERDGITTRLARHLDSAVGEETPMADEMDLATRAEEQAYLLRLADKEQKLLVEINKALARIEDGTYGVCEGTEEPIGLRRLEARPWSRYSIAFKEEMERQARQRARLQPEGGERRLNLAEAVSLFGALGVAVSDSFVSCWNAKYTYGVLRPETYIQRVIDPAWKPLLTTPPFPE